MERLDLLKGLSFGARIAEDEITELAKYFVETDQWNRILKGEIDVVCGDKGAGKSAIYSLLGTRVDDLFDKQILLVTAEKPRGDTVFKDLMTQPPTTEAEFIGLWKLYLASLIAQKIKELGISGDDLQAKKLIQTLEQMGFLKADFDLRSLFKEVRDYAHKWFNPKSVEGSIKIDPVTGLPIISGKITPGEPSSELRAKGFISVEMLAELANGALASADYTIWVLLDRLDVAFIDSHDLERNALRALFRVYRDFSAYERIKLKVFLRSDIWNRIVDGGFREASHITQVAILDWTPPSLLNLIIRRLLNNTALVAEYKIDKAQVLHNFDAQSALFYRFFPKQVEQGSKKRSTLDWMISRCADGTNNTAPRELIHLLTSLRELEIKRLERGELPPEGDQLFDRVDFKPALALVSAARLVQTLYAEYPGLKQSISELEGEKTEQTHQSLSTIWKVPDDEVAKRIAALVRVGFFQERGGRDNWTYWVPFLYRDALKMVQGTAEEE